MMKLDGISAFVCVAETGSITAAAQRLGLAKSVVSERLAELERALGVTLLQRSTRRSALTENGRMFLERARRIIFEAEEATAELARHSGELAGPLRISAPVSFGILHLGTPLHAFLHANPRIDLTLDLDDRFVDASADGFDAVIRHGPVTERHLVAHPLARSSRHLVASPAYLDAAPSLHSVRDLSAHRAIFYNLRESDWRFEGPGGTEVVRAHSALRLNNGLMMRGAALAGLGVALLPRFIVHDELRQGTLRVVELDQLPQSAELFVAHPRDRGTSGKSALSSRTCGRRWEIRPIGRRTRDAVLALRRSGPTRLDRHRGGNLLTGWALSGINREECSERIMPKPVVVTISHSMGREQARQRLKDRIGVAQQMLGTYRIGMIADDWDGDRLKVSLSALGQNVRGTVDVMDDLVRVEVQLPWLLAAFADRVKAVVQQKAPTLLGPPSGSE